MLTLDRQPMQKIGEGLGVHLSMLDRMGAPTDKLGDSTGRLDGLNG